MSCGWVQRRRLMLRGAVVVLWAALMARLLIGEVFPDFFRLRSAGYRAWLGGVPAITDQWMRILVQDQPIGYSHTRIDLRTVGGRDELMLQNRMRLSLSVLGQPRSVTLSSDAHLDADQRLRQFSFRLESDLYRFQISGQRRTGRLFDMVMETAALRRTFSVEIPDDAVLYSSLAEMQLAHLAHGRDIRVHVFDPVALSTTILTVRAIGREPIELDGAVQEALVVGIEYRGMTMRAWVSPEGRIWRQETPFGWTLESASARSALETVRANRTGVEVLDAAAVPIVAGSVPALNSPSLVIRLSGAPTLQRGWPVLPRQTVLRREPEAITLHIVAAPERVEHTEPLSDDERARGLETTMFVPHDHPEIRRQARAIAPNETDPLTIAEAIHHWVHAHIRKNPAISLPSALDVLRERSGDCNEHTYLFVALARARGLPARILVGLVPHEDALYYHAWPAVYVGGWIEMDPTLGLRRVGAAHIALAEGEMEGPMALIGLVGRLRAEFMDASHD